MERWLLLSNCQTFGLAHSLALLCPSLDIEAADLWTFQADPAKYRERLDGYDRVVVHPDVAHLPQFDTAGMRLVNYLPSIDFGAYHPDFGYFWVDEVFVNGPLSAYQSIIAIAAFNEGLGVAETRALYRGRLYEAAGYHADWAPQRDALIARYRDHGVDLSAMFRHWGRERAFMYSVNHPRIEAVHDVARGFLDALGMPTIATDVLPPDNLVAGPCLPVYDEIAEALGVRGSYLFKLNGEYRYITLDDFIARSFAVYAGYPARAIQPHPHYRARYDSVRAVIRGEA